MKSKYLIIIVYCVLIQSDSSSSRGLTNHDFCIKQSSECSGNFSYECKPDKCSVDKSACVYFNSIAFVLNSYRSKASYAKDRKQFDAFKSLITKCPVIIYEWKSTDFCLNKQKNCKTLDVDIITGIKTVKTVDCPCCGKHAHKCGENMCSVDKIACDHHQRNASKMASKLRLVSFCPRQKENRFTIRKIDIPH